MPACSTCNAVYRMECVYDTEGDRRRKSTAIEKERRSEDLDSLVTRLQNVSSGSEVETVVNRARMNSTTTTTAAAAIATTASSSASKNGQVRREKQKPDYPHSHHNHKESSEQIIVQDMGKLQIDELGDLRHFGHTSSLESIHSWPRRGLVPLPAADHTIPRPGPSWTNVTSDQDLISELLVRTDPLAQKKNYLLTIR